MAFEGSVAMLGEFLTGNLFLSQMGVLGATALMFVSSLVLCVMSFRSAGASRRAMRSAEELAREVRHLTAQIEQTKRRPATAHGLREAEETSIEVDSHGEEISLDDGDRAEIEAHETRLEAAKKSAIEPSALLRGRLRRR
jgi:hypothetical protein